MVRLYEQDIYSNYSGAVGGIGRAAAILQNYAGNLTGGAMMGILEDGQKLVDYVGRVVKAGANQAQSAAPQADMGIFRQGYPQWVPDDGTEAVAICVNTKVLPIVVQQRFSVLRLMHRTLPPTTITLIRSRMLMVFIHIYTAWA